MELTQNAQRLLSQRYFVDQNDSWDKLCERLVERVCIGETTEFKHNIYSDINNLVWLPNSPALANCGKPKFGAFACFVAGPGEDTLEDHLETLSDIASVAKMGGGCGFTGSYIRPENSPVAGSSHGYAYGPNKWAKSVSGYMDMMTQSGFRKMALMYTLDGYHPDAEKFLQLKQSGNERDMYNFNQSLFVSDKWMNQAINNKFSSEYNILVRLAYNAWNNGEPGLLFSDIINNNSPYQFSEQHIVCTNPCGEQPLPRYGACNLASINLNHEKFIWNGQFNHVALVEVVTNMTRFMDDIGSVNVFPNHKFENWYKENRPIGIGIMGFADLLLRLGVKYGEEKSLTLLSDIMSTIQSISYEESENLGKERGISSSNKTLQRRNATTVSIAPTGSIAFIAGCSHGIEPIFSPTYTRTDERGEKYIVEHEKAHEPYFVATIDSDNIPTWKQHIDIQAAAQSYCDSGISKTINFPENATVEDVYHAFAYAWENNCKGLTVYRNNSRQTQVLNSNGHHDLTKATLSHKKILCENCLTEMVTIEGCSSCLSCGSSLCSK
jgi:ribonucleoside-diphosphate reductase alpha chain